MLIVVPKLFRGLFIFLCVFWTSLTLAQSGGSSAENSTDFQEERDTTVNNAPEDFLGFRKRHSLLYAGPGFGQSDSALSGATQSFEIGYEKAQRPNMKWGFYLEYLKGDLKENFFFPNTGYSEERTNRVSIYTLGIQIRHKILRYLDIRAGLGASMTSMEVASADTDAPAPSTAVGHKETYPLSLNAKVALQLSKHFQNYGLALDFSHEQTALGMNHNVSVNSFNLIFRYFYNRK